MRLFRGLWTDSRGQDLVEYMLLAGMIAVAAIAFVPALMAGITNVLSKARSIIASGVI